MIATARERPREDGTIAIPAVLHAWGAPAEMRAGAV